MKTAYLVIPTFFLQFFLSIYTNAQSLSNALRIQTGFIENKGQIKPIPTQNQADVLFYMKNGGSFAYFFKDRVLLVSKRASRKRESSYSNLNNSSCLSNDIPEMDIARIDLILKNASVEKVIPSCKYSFHYNFFIAKDTEGVENIEVFQKLTYKNIYRNIDLIFYQSEDGSLKYDFLLHPGANPKEIILEYSGADCIKKKDDGSLAISNSFIVIKDKKPLTFYNNSKNDDKPLEKINSSFQLANNIISFQLDYYDKNSSITIDPNLEWSFMMGGRDGDHGYSLQLDEKNNIYLSGNTLSGDFPVTTGAWQYEKSGHFDAYIAKFDPSGKLLWATFFGGTQAEYVYDMKLDRWGNIVIGGWTWSSDMPVSKGAFQATFGGSIFTTDCFIAKFDNNGRWLWSTYYGSYSNEHINAIDVDRNGLIVVAGWTNSRNFVVSPNASQGTHGGVDDAFLARFTQDGEFIWATFFGSDSLDNATSVAYDKNGDIIMSGFTQSNRLNISKDAYQKSSNGANECFIVKYSPFGELIASTYFGGKSHDYAEDIAINSKNEILICGRTESDSLPFSEGNIQAQRKNKEDAFFAKFSTNLKLIWGSYLGGHEEDAAYGINVDANDDILITGRTNSNDFPLTEGAFMTERAGKFDAFVSKIDKSGKDFYWSTLVGGSEEEWGEDIISDDSLNVIISGTTSSPDFPVLGGISQNKFLGVLDIFLLKFCPTNPFPKITALGPTEFCKGDSVKLDAGAGYFSYLWSDGSKSRVISVKKSGDYFVTVTDSGGCSNTSAPVRIIVHDIPIPKFAQNIFICNGDTLALDAGSGFASYLWSTGDTTQYINVSQKGKYTCKVSDTFGCEGSATTEIFVNPKPTPKIEGPASVCLGSNGIEYQTKGVIGNKYEWSIVGGEITRGSTTNKIETLWLKSGSATLMLVETIPVSGCNDTTTFEVNISEELKPKIESSKPDNSFCEGDSIILDAGIGYAVYKWNDNSNLRYFIVKDAGIYHVTVWDNYGCKGSDTIIIKRMPRPIININGDSFACHGSISLFISQYDEQYSYNWEVINGEIIENKNNEIQIKWGKSRSGNVFLSVTNIVSGCSADTSIQVQLSPSPVPKINYIGSIEFCDGDSVVLYVDSQYPEILWDDGQTGDSIIVRNSGKHYLTVIDDNGCIGKDSVTVRVNPLPEKPVIILSNDTLLSSKADKYQWLKNNEPLQDENLDFFVPKESASYSVKVYNEFGCDNISDQFYYEISRPYAEFALADTIFANIGTDFVVPVNIIKSKDLQKSGAKHFRLVLATNSTIMKPVRDFKILKTQNSWSKIEYIVELKDTLGLVAALPFSALWGDTECATIFFESAQCIEIDVITATNNGVFCLKDLCKENDTRLFIKTEGLSLEIYPNPANDKVEITYTLREKGVCKLSIYNSLGTELAVLASGIFESGIYTKVFDVTTLPTGVYLVELTTPTKIMNKQFVIVK